MDDDAQVTIRDIDACLEQGQIFTSKIWMTVIMACGLFSIFLVVIPFVLLLIGEAENDNELFQLVCAIIIGFVLLVIDVLLYVIIHCQKKKISTYLQDAVIVRAKTKNEYGSWAFRFPFIGLRTTAIQLKFSYSGKHYVKSSIQKGKISCLHVYNKYVDKDILIAYSPTYDQVMLIKPKSEQRIRDKM